MRGDDRREMFGDCEFEEGGLRGMLAYEGGKRGVGGVEREWGDVRMLDL